jgi:FAD/FMN-containing dehydrogenase
VVAAVRLLSAVAPSPSKHGGRYYLPYQFHATTQQFESAYPEVAQLRHLKRRVDPTGKFSNERWRKYL